MKLFFIIVCALYSSMIIARDQPTPVSPGGMGQHSSVQEEGTTTRGTKILGPETMEHPTYPISGQLQRRSNDMTGRDQANSALMGSDVDPRVPSEVGQRGPVEKQAQEEIVIESGPYKNGNYQYVRPQDEDETE